MLCRANARTVQSRPRPLWLETLRAQFASGLHIKPVEFNVTASGVGLEVCCRASVFQECLTMIDE